MANHSPELLAAISLIGSITCNGALMMAQQSYHRWQSLSMRCVFCEYEWLNQIREMEAESEALVRDLGNGY